MTNDHSKTIERTKGFYKTPEKTVQYMCEAALRYSNRTPLVLDPAVGDGVFLELLSQKGLPREQLYGHDIDPDVAINSKSNKYNIILRDSLLNEYGQYDIIIGNPPYNSNECEYIKKHRNELKSKFTTLGAINLYPLFMYQGIKHLKENGILCMIVLDSFLNNVYYKPLRQYILNTCKIKEIILAPWRLFHSQKADVRTAIVVLQKYSGLEDQKNRSSNPMRLVDRVQDENEYWKPKKEKYVIQLKFEKMPDNIFFIGTVDSIISHFINKHHVISDFANGGAGISTGNDAQFLKRKFEVLDNPDWAPFYKSGKKNKYYYESEYYIEKDWQKNAKISKTFMIRNPQFYFREGITCSSVGLKFSASLLPEGSLFGVNTNLFCKTKEDQYFLLGLLNSNLAFYMLKNVLNRTNNISSSYVKMMPIIPPTDKDRKEIATIVERTVNALKRDSKYNYTKDQSIINEYFYELYRIPIVDRNEINEFCQDIYEKT